MIVILSLFGIMNKIRVYWNHLPSKKKTNKTAACAQGLRVGALEYLEGAGVSGVQINLISSGCQKLKLRFVITYFQQIIHVY